MDITYGGFIWDADKERENIIKHAVDFKTACGVFTDARRKIFRDDKHTAVEERLFCLGKVGGHILTVRFTYRGNYIRIIGAGKWRQGRKYYEK